MTKEKKKTFRNVLNAINFMAKVRTKGGKATTLLTTVTYSLPEKKSK